MNFFKKQNYNQAGFTLAEVLVTLVIIGVVAALTIPVVMNYFYEKQTVTQVKKYYSVITEAFHQWEVENSCVGDVGKCNSKYAYGRCDLSFKEIEENLNIVDKRYKGVNLATADWLPDETRQLNNDAQVRSWAGVSKKSSESSIACHYLFQDGTTMEVTLPFNYLTGGWVFIDVNGKKPPNRIGKDTFPIGIGSNGNTQYQDIHPYFAGPWTSSFGVCSVGNPGTTCDPDLYTSPTAYVLKHDKLPTLSPP